MVANLPSALKQKVLEQLRLGNFVAAKALHDQWMKQHQESRKPTKQ